MTARLLFWLFQAIALSLLAVVLLAPLADADSVLLRLFAHDAMLRRTALASGCALLATAWIFFRPAVQARAEPRGRRPLPPPVIGA